MRQTDFEKREKGKGGWFGFSVDMGARIVKSLLFWGFAAVLLSSSYTDIRGLQKGAWTGKTREVAEVTSAEQEAASAQNNAKNAAKAEQDSKIAEISKATDTGKRVALTFDDGPHRVYTKELLDGLAQRGVQATFFVIGKNIPGNEELIARMQQDGHLIGNHTYDHVRISDLSGQEACEQVEKTSALVREITGQDTEFVRPPFGAWNKSMEGSFTMIPVMWDVDPLDWTTKNKAVIEKRVLDNVDNGDIILLHDYYASSVEAALNVVDKLQEQGYEFVTVEKLILD